MDWPTAILFLVEPATALLADPIFRGIEGLLPMAVSLDPDAPAKLGPAVERAREAGVEHIVFVSAFGGDTIGFRNGFHTRRLSDA